VENKEMGQKVKELNRDYYKNENGQEKAHCKTEGMKDCCEVEKVRRGKQQDSSYTCLP
jgi:hypothetical protein